MDEITRNEWEGMVPVQREFSTPSITIKEIKTISWVTIPIWPDDIIVVVGPNSVWKSQFIKEIAKFFTDFKKKVIQELKVEYSGDITIFKHRLINNFSFKGVSYSSFNWDIQEAYIDQRWSDNPVFLKAFYSLFQKSLDTESRLWIAKSTDAIWRADASSTHIFHEFYKSSFGDELKKLNEYMYKWFKKYLINDPKWGKKLSFYTHSENYSESLSIDDYYRFIEEVVIKEGTLSDEEGDGLKSFIGVVGSCIVGSHNILCIDEPESFLHPPQAEFLWKIICEISLGKQLFLTTHSADFVRGIVANSSSRVKIVRIMREGNFNTFNVLDNSQVYEFLSDPILKYSNILNWLFNHKVIICESDSDCMFYQLLFDELQNDNPSQDYWSVLFVHTSTKDRMHIVAKSLLSLWIDIRVIADIDFLRTNSRTLYTTCSVMWIDLQAIQQHIITLNSCIIDWKKLKEKGIDNFGNRSHIRKIIINIIGALKAGKLFVIPWWELESLFHRIWRHGPKGVLKALENRAALDLTKWKRFLNEVVS